MYDEKRKSDIKAYVNYIIINRQQQQQEKSFNLTKVLMNHIEICIRLCTLSEKLKVFEQKIAHFPFIEKKSPNLTYYHTYAEFDSWKKRISRLKTCTRSLHELYEA